MNADGSPSELKFEIGHVLFIDIVGYSKLLIEEQRERLNQLTEIVLTTAQVRESPDERLVRLPTGDGMALVFRHSAEEPARCALEIAEALRKHPELPVRMGIHSGPVSEVTDVSGRTNIAGAGINMAQRVMDCGDAGHILLSQHVADDLVQYRQWAPRLRDLGDCEVKHGVRLHLVNLYAEPLGNADRPQKLQQAAPKSVVEKSGRRRSAGLIGALALLVLLGAGATYYFTTHRGGTKAAAVPDKSIAVLPFENLSSDKDNAYFAEGIQDEILTRLSKIAALKVISRTSTQKYKSAPDNLREVGQQLGVANLLEGSVQKAGNAVHINVQLIKAATDEHLWAESYDRELQNIFGVEGEVATAIADQLNAKLTGNEKKLLSAKPTSNPQAYDAYLRGLAFEGRVDALRVNTLHSIDAFAEAVRLDPQFAQAWAHLARDDSFMVNLRDLSPERQEAARKALEEALRLRPNLAETQLADGYYHYWVEKDYEGAKKRFESVRQSSPNNSEPPYALAAICRRQGEWTKARELFDQAIPLNPQDVFLLVDASSTYVAMRDAAGAQKQLARAYDLSPENAGVVAMQAVSYQMTGDLAHAGAVLSKVESMNADENLITAIINVAILSRDYGRALAMLKAQLERPQELGSSLGGFQNWMGDLQRHSGDANGAAASYTAARATLTAAVAEQPNNPDLLSNLSWAEAWLGDQAASLAHAQQAVAAMPASKDAWIGPTYEESLARIEAHFADKESAIAAVQHLLSISYGIPPITRAVLRIDPDWDNLRGDPRFQKLCQEPNK